MCLDFSPTRSYILQEHILIEWHWQLKYLVCFSRTRCPFDLQLEQTGSGSNLVCVNLKPHDVPFTGIRNSFILLEMGLNQSLHCQNHCVILKFMTHCLKRRWEKGVFVASDSHELS